MKFTSTKQTLTTLAVFLTILLLGSCSVAEDTAPPNNPPGGSSTTFQQDIENATTVPNLATANALTREVLEPLNVATGTTLVKRYVTTNGAGSRDGSSWATAWAATNLRNAITNITDATASRVYLVMVAGGTYKPTDDGNRNISFSMTNHVAIMGGFQTGGGWGRTGTTIFSGDIGTVGTTTDNSYHVFFHNGITLGNAHLYGVTITNGNANGSFPNDRGGGMYNNASSPVLTEVVFSGNTTTSRGGGMYNFNLSSPVLTRVVFSGNNADGGGGMYNNASSPMLTRVVFSGNSATGSGGGMYNFDSSSPVLTGVVFSGNTGNGGGGMYNLESSPVMIGSVFTNNRATSGGGILNDNGSAVAGPLIVNTIFSGNSATVRGPDIVMDLGTAPGNERIRIAGSVLGLGPPPSAQPTNAVVGFNGSDAINITYHSLANGAVNFGADATFTVNGMSFPYPTIVAGSSAINLGLYVRKHVNGSTTTYYFSETGSGTSWHTSFTSTGTGGLAGTAMDLPTTGTIEDLTATDIAGNARNARPDAGVYEVR